MKKINRFIKRKLRASMTTYVMLMFGIIVVCYLMGFQSPWLSYTQQEVAESGETITEAKGIGDSILDWIMTGIKSLFKSAEENPVLAIIGTIITAVSFYLLSKVGGQFALQYIIPIIIIGIFMNIFVFPTSTLQAQVIAPFDAIIFGFLNLFLILSIIEFVRGSI